MASPVPHPSTLLIGWLCAGVLCWYSLAARRGLLRQQQVGCRSAPANECFRPSFVSLSPLPPATPYLQRGWSKWFQCSPRSHERFWPSCGALVLLGMKNGRLVLLHAIKRIVFFRGPMSASSQAPLPAANAGHILPIDGCGRARVIGKELFVRGSPLSLEIRLLALSL